MICEWCKTAIVEGSEGTECNGCLELRSRIERSPELAMRVVVELGLIAHPLNFNQYQKEAMKTAVYPQMFVRNPSGGLIECNWVYPLIGLFGEAGEIAEKLKKVLRDGYGIITVEDTDALEKELGDVGWYWSEIARKLGLSLQHIVIKNIKKLTSRAQRNKIHGSGDSR